MTTSAVMTPPEDSHNHSLDPVDKPLYPAWGILNPINHIIHHFTS
jgi:hypothetical protein